MPGGSETFVFHIKTVTGLVIDVEHLTPQSTVYNIREVLQERQGIPLHQRGAVRLVFRGKPLSDDEVTLESIGIENEAVVHMVIPIRAGV